MLFGRFVLNFFRHLPARLKGRRSTHHRPHHRGDGHWRPPDDHPRKRRGPYQTRHFPHAHGYAHALQAPAPMESIMALTPPPTPNSCLSLLGIIIPIVALGLTLYAPPVSRRAFRYDTPGPRYRGRHQSHLRIPHPRHRRAINLEAEPARLGPPTPNPRLQGHAVPPAIEFVS